MSTFKKAWLLLNHKQKNHAIFIFALMFLAMILETLSIGVILPLLSVLLKGNIDTSIFSFIFAFGELTGKNLIYIGLSVTLIIFLLKSLYIKREMYRS